jgi:hypothetical protein
MFRRSYKEAEAANRGIFNLGEKVQTGDRWHADVQQKVR